MEATATRAFEWGPFPGLSYGGKLQLEHGYTAIATEIWKGGGKPQGCNYHLRIWREKSN